MRHAKLRDRLGPYLEGSLRGEQRVVVEAHLERCPACRRELGGLRRTVELLRALPEVEPPQHLADRLLARIREEETAAQVPGASSLLGAWGLPALFGAVGVGVLLLFQGIEISIGVPLDPRLPPEPAARAVAAVSGLASRPQPVVEFAPAATPMGTPPSTPESAADQGPLPPLASCTSSGRRGPAAGACARLHSWLIDLAIVDPLAFLAEVEAVPPPARDRMLGDLSALAASTGFSPLVAHELRSAGDPRASRFALRFERVRAGR